MYKYDNYKMLVSTKWVCIKNHKKIGCRHKKLSSKQLKIYLFHVKNESILIQMPRGKNILFDCGSKDKDIDLEIKEMREKRVASIGIGSHKLKNIAEFIFRFGFNFLHPLAGLLASIKFLHYAPYGMFVYNKSYDRKILLGILLAIDKSVRREK